MGTYSHQRGHSGVTMKVTLIKSNRPDVPLTTDFPPTPGIMWRWLKGDVCDPQWWFNGGSAFKFPLPRFVIRFKLRIPLPYISWRTAGGRGGYLGMKVYGVDSPFYKNYIPAADVYPGSQALELTARPFATLD